MGKVITEDEPPVQLLSSDEEFHFELLLPLGEAIYGGADLANETKAAARDPLQACDPVNIRDTWLSAAIYFRRADFFLHGNPDDPRIEMYWEEQVAAFDKGLAALPVPGKRIQVPAHNFTIEAIWYAPSRERCIKKPTIILGNGYDGSQEDLYHTIAIPDLARGWNVLTYEGPGQPLVRRQQILGFIPDCECVVTPLVDYVLNNQSAIVDPDHVVLFGYSFGGYSVARAAAFESRLAAVSLDGGISDILETFMAFLPEFMKQAFKSGGKETFDAAVVLLRCNASAPTSTLWGVEQGLWSFNTRLAYDWFVQLKQYHVSNYINQINMPVWIVDGVHEGFFEGQAIIVKEALGKKATYHLFHGSAGYHCQVGAIQELGRVTFAWLHQTLW